MQGTFFLTCSQSSDVLGPLAVKMILPCKTMIILGLHVEWNQGKARDYIFSCAKRIISTLFQNSSITFVCRFLQKGVKASQGPLQEGQTSTITSFGFFYEQKVRKWSASRIVVVKSTFFFEAIQCYNKVIIELMNHVQPNQDYSSQISLTSYRKDLILPYSHIYIETTYSSMLILEFQIFMKYFWRQIFWRCTFPSQVSKLLNKQESQSNKIQ